MMSDDRSVRTTPLLLFVLGTRPEAVKLAPVVRACSKRGLGVRLLSTGQHREILDQTLGDLGLMPDEDMHLMVPEQTLAGLSARAISQIDSAFERLRPDYVVVQGDTTTVAMAALTAYYRRIPIGHVEAGLRSGLRKEPFPEEVNRQLVGVLAEDHFAPTEVARANLLASGVQPEQIHVVGNTGIDSLLAVRRSVQDTPLARLAPQLGDLTEHPLVLFTCHRRESFGAPLEAITRAVARLAERFPDVRFICPVHPNPAIRETLVRGLGSVSNVRLVEPLPYPTMVKLMTVARCVITDSGGLQEETATLGCPTLVVRRVTDRPEAVSAGVAALVGTETDAIVEAGERVLGDPLTHAAMARPVTIFGDGTAGERIAGLLAARLGYPSSLEND